MLKKYLFFILLPLSMTSFGQSLHAEKDASENSQQTLSEESQQALTKETVTKNLDLEKANRWRRFFSGTFTLLLEGIVSLIGGSGIQLILAAVIGGQFPPAKIVAGGLAAASLLFSLLAGCMSFNAAFKLKIVDKNGEDTTFKQRFWYAFSAFLLPFVYYTVEYIVFWVIKERKVADIEGTSGFFILSAPFLVIIIAQFVLLIAKKKTLSEYVTGMQVVKKKPSAPVAK